MGKFIVIKSYIKREERSQIYNSFLQFKELEKGGQTNPKASRVWKNKYQSREKPNENMKTMEKINETKRWLCKKINRIDKPLSRLTKKKERRVSLPKSKMKVGTLLLILQK